MYSVYNWWRVTILKSLRQTNVCRSFLIERSCPIEGFAFIDTRSHTMEFHLENRGLLDRCLKNSRCKRHWAQKGTRAVFPRVSPCYAPRAIPSHSLLAQFLPFSSALPPCDLSRLSTFSPLYPDTPQMPCLRFRTPLRRTTSRPDDVCLLWRHKHVPGSCDVRNQRSIMILFSSTLF